MKPFTTLVPAACFMVVAWSAPLATELNDRSAIDNPDLELKVRSPHTYENFGWTGVDKRHTYENFGWTGVDKRHTYENFGWTGVDKREQMDTA
ncbi:hypothetical protein CERZMDRAFT_95505 [Cercospora zeae-maydis SCOH1-5]|uniref:Uncharacterized protein n=1 Tax=Cercospora zeae-maydis SCOH1-5 TaxID=717836 RepID=A0A6A6FLZ7_9PEZI|nr:hypothetical protein CERZMDRAFT_95505 [Cercospora zeae-maydis SCOH1-5]